MPLLSTVFAATQIAEQSAALRELTRELASRPVAVAAMAQTLPPPTPPPGMSAPASPDTPTPLLLNLVQPATQDPRVLWDRAGRLASDGVPIVRMRTTISSRAFDDPGADDFHVRILPSSWPQGAVRLVRVPADSLFGKLGLMAGDVLTSINGRSAADPDDALTGFQELRTRHTALLEVLRDGRWLVIHVQVEAA